MIDQGSRCDEGLYIGYRVIRNEATCRAAFLELGFSVSEQAGNFGVSQAALYGEMSSEDGRTGHIFGCLSARSHLGDHYLYYNTSHTMPSRSQYVGDMLFQGGEFQYVCAAFQGPVCKNGLGLEANDGARVLLQKAVVGQRAQRECIFPPFLVPRALSAPLPVDIVQSVKPLP